jgi:hypothetical protein
MEHPRVDYRRCGASLAAMRSPRRLITCGVVSLVVIVLFFVVWIVMLGPALMILMTPSR